MLYCVFKKRCECSQAARQDVQDEIYDRVADKVSAVRTVFKELCAGERDAWQTLAQRKKLPLHEMRNLAKSKSIQALACCNVVKFLRCIAVFHTQFLPLPSLFPQFRSFRTRKCSASI